MKQDQLFFVGQKAFIKKGKRILVLSDPLLGIDFPGGKIQAGEDNLVESLKREVREETGLEINVGNPFLTWIHTIHRDEHKGKKLFLVAYECEYISGVVKISNEHDGFTWVTRQNFKDIKSKGKYFKYLEHYFEQETN
jgi:8-oxo-dGTP pyrophosphatase MutT (NUDIX family)